MNDEFALWFLLSMMIFAGGFLSAFALDLVIRFARRLKSWLG